MLDPKINSRAGLLSYGWTNPEDAKTHAISEQGFCKKYDCTCPKSEGYFKATEYQKVQNADLLWSLGKGSSPFRLGGEYQDYIELCTKKLGHGNRQDWRKRTC